MLIDTLRVIVGTAAIVMIWLPEQAWRAVRSSVKAKAKAALRLNQER
ncbi:hypothetical protein [Caballeronia sp. DA-9]